MPITYAHSGMEIIPLTECIRLLGSRNVGRLGFVLGDQPMVLPVNYTIHGDVIVFRTGEGSKLEAAPGAKVAFEVDDFDALNDVEAATGRGWSVMVQGVAEDITDGDDWFTEVLRRGTAPSWLPGAAGHYVRIKPTLISGRRLPVAQPVAPAE